MDLNCDMGESFGRYTIGEDEEVMPYITSVNVACGLHAGDPAVMHATVRLAKQHGVAVGAHPGWPDLQGFGRREMSMTPDEAEGYLLYQIGALAAFARQEGVKLRHVKPHGALYNQAAIDRALADVIARTVWSFDKNLILVGLAGSALVKAGAAMGLRVANEAFPDRRYNADGTLTSRKQTGALVADPQDVAANAVTLARDGILFGGKRVRIDTLCLHGDNTHAAQNAQSVRIALEKARIPVKPLQH
ncbi:MAG TPA: 5-oxoprolinase subunit PxpA [Anaerolineales bacterium]|nr:5-oxoprolinase subunit PxpA [Anaerolineales bacterium]